MCKLENQFKLTLFNKAGIQTESIEGLTHEQAYELAESKRPKFGSSYVTRESTELKFKPYRPTWPKRGYRYPSLRRPTKKAIEATATRFAKDGDHTNSAVILGLLK